MDLGKAQGVRVWRRGRIWIVRRGKQYQQKHSKLFCLGCSIGIQNAGWGTRTVIVRPPNQWRKASGFPGGSVVKNHPANERDTGSTPGSGRCPGEGNGNPLQNSCLENPMDRGASRAKVHEVSKESDMT